MVDFSLPISDMILLQRCCKELTWIDHHKTAIMWRPSKDFSYWTPGGRKAACELAWDILPKITMLAAVFLLVMMFATWKADSRVMDFQLDSKPTPISHRNHLKPFSGPGMWDGGRLNLGHFIRKYQRTQDEKSMARFSSHG